MSTKHQVHQLKYQVRQPKHQVHLPKHQVRNQNTKYAVSIKRLRQTKHQKCHPTIIIIGLSYENTNLRCFVARPFLSRIYALFWRTIFKGLKMRWRTKMDKYEVCKELQWLSKAFSAISKGWRLHLYVSLSTCGGYKTLLISICENTFQMIR